MLSNTKITNNGIFRTCHICKIEKPLENFYKDRTCSFGHSYECIDCRKKVREQNKDWMHKYSKEYKQNLKFSVMAVYCEGQPFCQCCGESIIEFLTIDHINNDGADHRRKITKRKDWGGHMFYQWIIKNDFPDDLQVLCGSCQLGKKINGGICPHKTMVISP